MFPLPQQKKARREENSSLLTHLQSDLLRSDGLDGLDYAAIVIAALRAHSVGQMLGTALSACNKTGSCQLPGGAPSFIASCLGYFSLRDCHGDTSLIFKSSSRCSYSLLIAILEKLGQNSQPWICFLLTGTGAEVQIGTAATAQSFAIF